MVWLRSYFTGVILTHVGTFQPISSKIRKTIKQPVFGNAPVGPPIIGKLNCTDQSLTTDPMKRSTISDTITGCSIKIHTKLKYPCRNQQNYSVKWASASANLAAECRSCTRYFFSLRLAATNDNADSKLPLYQVRPLPKHRKRKSIQSK